MDYHVISYFTEEDINHGRLLRPNSRKDLLQLALTPDLIRSSDFRRPPPVQAGRDGRLYMYVFLVWSKISRLKKAKCSFDAEEAGVPVEGVGVPSSSTIRRAAAGRDATTTTTPHDTRGFMHRWAISPPGVNEQQSQAGAYHTLSFSETALQRTTERQPSSSSSSSAWTYYGLATSSHSGSAVLGEASGQESYPSGQEEAAWDEVALSSAAEASSSSSSSTNRR